MKKKFGLQVILRTLQSVLPKGKNFIALHEPLFNGNEWIYVKDCLDRGWVSSAGQYVDRFEQQLIDFTGVKYAVAVVNGTAALHVCLQLTGVTPGDEVLLPSLTFIATANAVSYCGAVPHLVDSEATSLGIDPHKLEYYLDEISIQRPEGCFNKKTGRRIRAVVPMHTFGHPADMDPLAELCRKYKLVLIEDAAESIGSYYKGRHTGNMGITSILSFNGNKTVTTGGGGAILTNDRALAVLARHLTTQAKLPHKWAFNHDRVGYNYRMPNINAALGCAQIEQLPDFIKRKRNLASCYQEAFAEVEGVEVFKEASWASSNYWLNILILDKKYAAERDNLLELTDNNGIMTRPAWHLIHEFPMYNNCPHMDTTIAKDLEQRIINLPSSASLWE